MKFIVLIKCFALSFCAFCFSCNSFAVSSNELLVNYVDMGVFNRNTARAALNKMPPLDSLAVHHHLHLYKINYKTPDPYGNQTVASGLVAMPIKPANKVGIVSYQHGTRFEKNDVPSRNNEKNYMYLAAFGSSAGYMTVMPDYLGLGDNDLPLHPYVQAETLASSSVNMLIAAKELAKLLNYPVSDKLYLAGYSEGGFSTNVMFESLVNDYPELPVSAVASGSAPYDWQETMKFIMLDPGPRATAYLAYFLYTLQSYKHYWTGLDEIFVAPYNTLIPKLLNGYHTVPEILGALPLNPQFILQPAFFNGIINQTDRNIDVLKASFNHLDFIPNAPFLIIGSKGDRDLPYHAAEMAYEVFSQKSDLVSIKSVSDTLDHIQAHPYVLKEQVEFFKRFEQ